MSTQLKTELIEDAEQMEMLDCQCRQGLPRLVGGDHREDSWGWGRLYAGDASHPGPFTRGGLAPGVGARQQ